MRKSEPHDFRALIGQADVAGRLAETLKAPGASFHLITGAPGLGKRFVARLLANALLCEHPNKDGACGLCKACLLFAANNHIDYHDVVPTDKTIIPTETVRKAIADVNVAPRLGERQVIVFDGNALNEQGQNALLKSLETPPPFVSFIITVNSELMLLPTIRSRASWLRLTTRDDAALRSILDWHGITAEPSIERAVRYAAGNPGRALALVVDDEYGQRRREATQLLYALPGRRIADVLTKDLVTLKSIKEAGEGRLHEVFEVWSESLRDALAVVVAQKTPSSVDAGQAQFLTALRRLPDLPAAIRQCESEVLSVKRALTGNASVDTALAHLLLYIRKELYAEYS